MFKIGSIAAAICFNRRRHSSTQLFPSNKICSMASFSGASRGASIGHISPEAAVGGPIALVQEGDRIRVDIPNTRLELLVSDEELEKRRAQWQPKEPKVTTGYLARYAAMVTSGNRGAVLEIPKQ